MWCDVTGRFTRMASAADFYVFRSEFARYFAFTQFAQQFFA